MTLRNRKNNVSTITRMLRLNFSLQKRVNEKNLKILR